MLGFEFDDNTTPFAVYIGVQSLACVAFEIIESFVVGTRLRFAVYTVIISLIGIITNSAPYFFNFREKKSVIPDKLVCQK